MAAGRIQQLTVPAWTFVVGGLWLAVGFAVADIVGASEVLPDNILAALRPERNSLDGDLIQICTWGSPDALGVQLLFLSLLFGGVPAAVLGAVLPATRRTAQGWSAPWEKVFLAMFVFQLSSLALTTLLLIALGSIALEAGSPTTEIYPYVMFLLLSALCSAWGVRSWHALRSAVEQTAATSSLRQRLPFR